MSHDLARRTLYPDRAEAGRCLVASLSRYAGRADVIVLALPRGGVPVAYEGHRTSCGATLIATVRSYTKT